MNLKRMTALALAAALALSAAACSSKDVTWVAQMGENKVAAGTYVLNVMNAISQAAIEAEIEATPDDDALFKADIDGKTGSQYIVDYAKDEMLSQLAASSKFAELGLTMTDEEKKQFEDYAKQMYASDSEMLTANGISEQSLIDFNRYSFESYKLFETLYGPGGEKEPPAEEANKYFADTYYLAYAVPYLKVNPQTGAPLEGEELAKVSADADAAYKAIGEGKKIADVVFDMTLAQIPEGGEKPARGADTDYLMVVDKVDVNGYFPPVLTEHLATAEIGKVTMIEDEQYKIIVQRVDETAPDPEMAKYYYSQMIPQLKFEEFRAYCIELGKGMSNITWNDPALAHYTGEKVKKDTDAYIKKQEAAQSSSMAAANPAPESSSAPAESSSAPADSSSAPAESTAPDSSSTAG